MNLAAREPQSAVSVPPGGRPRPAGLRLLAVGAVLLLGAGLSWAGLVVTQIDGHRWAESSLVPADGRPHTVGLSSDRSAMLWSYESFATPPCTASDATTGQALPLSPADGSYRREGGSAGDWFGAATFQPQSATVVVTCAFGEGAAGRSSGRLGDGGGILVAVETAPAMPPSLATFGPWGALPVAIALTGLLAVAAAALVNVRRRAAASAPG